MNIIQKCVNLIKEKIIIIYELIIILLAFVAVTITLLDLAEKISIDNNDTYYYIDLIILIIFTIDYLIRITLAENKKKFFKENIFDLIAIIPFNSIFRIFRTFRLLRIVKVIKIFRLVRFIALFKKLGSKLRIFLNTNGFIYVSFITFSAVILGAFAIYIIEKGKTIKSFGDALWWSCVTISTVGYGDISPSTTGGRIVAVLLMFLGIGFIGMFTGTIATFFIKENSNKINIECDDIDLKDLSKEELNNIRSYVEFIKSKRNCPIK